MNSQDSRREWLEADGLGGFACGTAQGLRTRRYHSLLTVALTPPTHRVVLVNGLEAWLETSTGSHPLSCQHYAPEVVTGDAHRRVVEFGADPWPHWIFHLSDGTRVALEIFSRHESALTCLAWRLLDPRPDARLHVRLLLSGRDYHSLHHCNPVLRFDAEITPGRVTWQTYPGLPAISASTNGTYVHDPCWYYRFRYAEEHNRGLDDEEDLAAPGVHSWDLSLGPALMVLGTRAGQDQFQLGNTDIAAWFEDERAAERRRRDRFTTRLHRAADAYIVRRGTGRTLIAGYPWFTDWGRDTFIALRGLTLATDRLDVARAILLSWTEAVSAGMLPNRFPDQGEAPEFNAVDAALWFVVAAYEYRRAALRTRLPTEPDWARLRGTIQAILTGYRDGTRYGIRADADGLLACGVSGVQLTWMDARVGDHVVTPRIGKPVEIQALWLNALWIAAQDDATWTPLLERGRRSFAERFWDEQRGRLHDVVDVDHVPGTVDPSFRPNQIFAVGGLPLALVDGERAARIVGAVHQHLWTPLGLRTLAPEEPGYVPHYTGSPAERDRAYHQGTAWPWLLGAFVEAWLRVHPPTPDSRAHARREFLQPLLDHLDDAGLGHISEIVDAEPPHTPRGCPWQAWSVGETLWLDRVVLAEADPTRRPPSRSKPKPTAEERSSPTRSEPVRPLREGRSAARRTSPVVVP